MDFKRSESSIEESIKDVFLHFVLDRNFKGSTNPIITTETVKSCIQPPSMCRSEKCFLVLKQITCGVSPSTPRPRPPTLLRVAVWLQHLALEKAAAGFPRQSRRAAARARTKGKRPNDGGGFIRTGLMSFQDERHISACFFPPFVSRCCSLLVRSLPLGVLWTHSSRLLLIGDGYFFSVCFYGRASDSFQAISEFMGYFWIFYFHYFRNTLQILSSCMFTALCAIYVNTPPSLSSLQTSFAFILIYSFSSRFLCRWSHRSLSDLKVWLVYLFVSAQDFLFVVSSALRLVFRPRVISAAGVVR